MVEAALAMHGRRFSKLHLIYPPIQSENQGSQTNFSPSLSLLAIKYYIESHYPNCAVVYADHTRSSLTEIKEDISREHTDLVGISPVLTSYGNALRIAQFAKEQGAVVILGGHNSTALRREIVQNRRCIDAVISNDGEESVRQLVSGAPWASIPNLTYYSEGVVYANTISQLTPAQWAPITFEGIDFSRYDLELKKSVYNAGISPVIRYLRVYSHKGCDNRGNSSACSFCTRIDSGVRFKPPRQFLEEMQFLNKRYGARYFFDVGDDFMHSLSWIQATLEMKKREFPSLDINLGIFARANRIQDIAVAKLLQELGVVDVQIGFESGDEKVLAKVGKNGSCISMNITAAKHLFSVGIDVCASYVLGLPGETPASLEKTVQNAQEVAELSVKLTGQKPKEIAASIIEPGPGSRLFEFLKRRLPQKYDGADDFDLKDLQQDYFMQMFGMKREEALEFRKRLVRVGQSIHSLGQLADPQGYTVKDLEEPDDHRLC